VNNTIYKHRPTTPDWMYHQANLDTAKLSIIQKELLKLFLITKKENLVPYTSTFVEINDKELMQKTCATLMQEFKQLGIYDNFFVISFIW
jgi:hypothetical protein